MQLKRYTLLLVALLLPAILMAAGGKIRGKVTDRESGEALVGATVQVVGTSYGGTTDVNGVFTILNLDPGTYTLKASYIGYQAITLANVRVNADLTTESNFALPAEGVKVQTVEIIAQRPLINKSATNSVRIIDNDFFNTVPFRGVTAAVALQPGVVERNGNIYIRGGRADETGFQLEGVNVTNVYSGGRAVTFSQDAVEQIQVQTGGYGAEYGGANAGIVSTQLRSGGEAWKASLSLESDNYTGQAKKSLGGYSYGYSDYVATFGGPVMSNKIRFFGTVENQFNRDPGALTGGVATPSFWGGANFKGLVTDPQYTAKHPTQSISDTLNIAYQAGNRLGGSSNVFNYAGTLLFDLGNIQVRGAGSYSTNRSQNAATVSQIFNLARLPLNLSSNGFGNVKLTQFLNPKTYYEVNLNYFTNDGKTMDPLLQENYNVYGDSLANAKVGQTLIQANGVKGANNTAWTVFGPTSGGGISFDQPGTVETGYSHTSQSSIGGRLDFSSQMNNHGLKFGGEYTRYTIRRFVPSRILGRYLTLNDPSLTQAEKAAVLRGGGSDNFGYDVFGNLIDSDVKLGNTVVDYGPRHPVFGAGYVEDKIELPDIILNIGLRYDYISSDGIALVNPHNITFVDSLNVISSSSIKTTPATSQISPRIGFSFPVTDRTVFHAQYGKFIQQSQLVDTYEGTGRSFNIVNGGNYYQSPQGYGLLPERTTQYEMGFSDQVADNASFDITAFYKDIRDQIQYRVITPAAGAANRNYVALENGDFATTKGVEFKVTMRRVQRVQAQINYTFSDARSTGSTSNSEAGGATDQHGFVPTMITPMNTNQTHRGSVSLDYRFAKNDGGSILERSGLNILAQFASGYPFTLLRIDAKANEGDSRFQIPLEPLGSSTTPWTFEVDARLDKTVTFGPMDATFYIYVQNLLNSHNAVGVYPRTGDPANDGWLGTAAGQQQVATYGPQYADVYNAVFLGDNSGNYAAPRQIRFGVKVEY